MSDCISNNTHTQGIWYGLRINSTKIKILYKWEHLQQILQNREPKDKISKNILYSSPRCDFWGPILHCWVPFINKCKTIAQVNSSLIYDFYHNTKVIRLITTAVNCIYYYCYLVLQCNKKNFRRNWASKKIRTSLFISNKFPILKNPILTMILKYFSHLLKYYVFKYFFSKSTVRVLIW